MLWPAVLIAALLICVYGYLHCWFGNHVWSDATCTTPKICTRCGETTGSALGHNLKDATNTSAKTCTRCGETTLYTMRSFGNYNDPLKPFWGQTKYVRKEVVKIQFQSSLKDCSEDAWDISEAGDKSVMAWMDSKTLHVGANGIIQPNKDASYLFAYFKNLKSIDFGECFDTSDVTNMAGMFTNCSSLTSLDLSSFNTSNVIDMGSMFRNCINLTSLDLSSFNTSNATNMNLMFYGCNSLTSLDLSSFITSNVTNMNSMFSNCSSLTNLKCNDSQIKEAYNKR